MTLNLNKTAIAGNVARDPFVRYMDNGTAMAKVIVVTNEYYTNKKTNERVESATFHDVTFWGKQAEFIEHYVRKGSPVYVEGKMQNRKYTDKEGNEQYVYEIVGSEIQFTAPAQASKEPNP